MSIPHVESGAPGSAAGLGPFLQTVAPLIDHLRDLARTERTLPGPTYSRKLRLRA